MIQKDLNLKSNALFGTKNYSYTETSSVSPSELMTGSDWLNQPNKSQKKYLDTEAVYRQFVYENYQTVDQGLEKRLLIYLIKMNLKIQVFIQFHNILEIHLLNI